MKSFLRAGCLGVFLGMAVLSFAQSTVITGSRPAITIDGTVSDGSQKVLIKVEPQNTAPGTSREYKNVPVGPGGAYSKEVDVFPGKHIVTIKSDTVEEERDPKINAEADNLIIEFKWRPVKIPMGGDPPSYYIYEPGMTLKVNNKLASKSATSADWHELEVEFKEADLKAGLYRIYASCWYSVKPSSAFAGVYGLLDGHLAFPAETHNLLHCTWHVATLVIHKDDKTGGYRVIEYDDGGGGKKLPIRDMVEGKVSVAKANSSHAVTPRSNFEVLEENLTGPNGTNDVYLCVGQSAQFRAIGTVCGQTNMGILEQFKVTKVEGEGHVTNIVYMDGIWNKCQASEDVLGPREGLGVLTGLAPGHVKVECNTGSYTTWESCGRTIHVHILRIDFTFPEQPDKTPSLNYPYSGTVNGKKWVVATFPPPVQTTYDFSAKLLGLDNADADFKYKRGNGQEVQIPWSGTPGNVKFDNGELNVEIRLVDGSTQTPQMSLNGGVLTISGVQQGDKIILEEPNSGCRDQTAVVKNFTWNDVQRVGLQNFRVVSTYDSLSQTTRNALKDLAVFCLDNRATRDQKNQLNQDWYPDTGQSTHPGYADFQQQHPNLANHDIPSARSIGAYPDDFEHFHLGLEVASLPADLQTKKNQLLQAVEGSLQSAAEFQENTAAKLIELMNATTDLTDLSFLLAHTYEGGEAQTVEYEFNGVQATHHPGDPTRNIRINLTTGATPKLTFPGQEDTADWEHGDEAPVEVLQIGLFVNHNGKIVPIGANGAVWAILFDHMRADALENW